MSKKLIFMTFLLIASIFTFGLTSSFATDNNMVNDATNGARNMVNNAENTVEGAIKNMGET